MTWSIPDMQKDGKNATRRGEARKEKGKVCPDVAHSRYLERLAIHAQAANRYKQTKG